MNRENNMEQQITIQDVILLLGQKEVENAILRQKLAQAEARVQELTLKNVETKKE